MMHFESVDDKSMIVNADCFEYLQTFKPKFNAIITDPPYDIPTINGGGSVNNVKQLNKSLNDINKSNLNESYDIETFAQLTEALYLNDINAMFWCNKKQIPEYFKTYVEKRKCKFQIICWHKTNALPTYSNKYLSDTEYLLYFYRGKGKCFPQSYEDAKTFYVQPINHKDKKLYGHPTIKPLNIIEACVRNITREGDDVLDPFMGSGTTCVACKNTNRNFTGVELDEKYFKMAKKRIKGENK